MLKAKGNPAPSSGFVEGQSQAVPCVQPHLDGLDGPIMDEEDGLRERLGAVVNALCEWLYPQRCRQATVLLRAYAFVWFLRPEWLGNPSQVQLAERLNVTKQTLGKVINQLRDKFGFYVTGMRGEEARGKFARLAKRNAVVLAEARRKANRKAKGK